MRSRALLLTAAILLGCRGPGAAPAAAEGPRPALPTRAQLAAEEGLRLVLSLEVEPGSELLLGRARMEAEGLPPITWEALEAGGGLPESGFADEVQLVSRCLSPDELEATYLLPPGAWDMTLSLRFRRGGPLLRDEQVVRGFVSRWEASAGRVALAPLGPLDLSLGDR